MLQGAATKGFKYVPEATDRFLALFPHRYDYIWSEHPRPSDRPHWQTENRHPLSDRLIRSGAYLYGVRFGPETRYLLLDIDKGSPYHPVSDRFAVEQIVSALNPIGLNSHLAITSSYSGGLHVYIPFDRAIASWKIAAAANHLIESAGYTIEPGVLEILPNPRSYDPKTTTLYKAHRLPLQPGSYLLNQDWEQCHTSEHAFVTRFEWCMSKNHIQNAELEQAIKNSRKQSHKFSHRASKFLNDLNADIDAGWSGTGQTNSILGRIAMREYIFRHVVEQTAPLKGEQLVCAIVGVAVQLPGYLEYCRHQHEIWTRAEEWARCVEASRYWQYKVSDQAAAGEPPTQPETELHTRQSWQKWEAFAARDKLRYAIANLLERGKLPSGARARFEILTKEYRVSGATLYKNRDLWHPEAIAVPEQAEPVENPPGSPPSVDQVQEECLGAPPEHGSAPSLLVVTWCNNKPRATFKRSVTRHIFRTRCNSPPEANHSDLDDDLKE